MFVRRAGTSEWTEVSQLPSVDLEKELETLLAESPELLPGRPEAVALVHQLHVPRINGYLDLCAVTPDGRVYLIEVKLSGNSEMRRYVVGQLLAYAAALTGTSPEELLVQFARAGSDPREIFAAGTGEQGADELELFPERLATTLREGRFTLVFAVDRLTDELGLVVDYLQQQMTTVDVCALELRYSRFEETELMSTTLRGAQLEAPKSTSTLPPVTTDESFDQALAVLPQHVQHAFRRIRQATEASGGRVWGSRKTQPTLGAAYVVQGREVNAWMMSARRDKPGFGLMWRWMHGHLPDAALTRLYDELRDLPGAHIWHGVERKWNYVNYLDASVTFAEPEAVERLLEAVHTCLGVPLPPPEA
jgi:hypothetical protein